METKVCSKCRRNKPLSDFYKQENHSDGLRSACKDCLKKADKKYRDSEIGQKVSKTKYQRKKKMPNAKKHFQDQYLWRTYKIRITQKEQMYLAQNGCCIICEKPISFDLIFIDHRHLDGKIRELLCPACNTFVGHIENKRHLVDKIIKYLEKHNVRK